ncbi:MAG TPA: hypothetical protein VJ802_05195 [Gemmatimonadaceae bacterium]|nr:hypothetical protein [Gemmatimonadaceae bacterium]
MLRDSVDWVAGIPTLDVHAPRATPYPWAFEREGGLIRRMYDSGGPHEGLTPEQLLGLYNVLPASGAVKSSGEIALAPLRQWMRDHPDEASRFPAATILHSAFWEAELERVRALRSPVAGTYRLAVVLPTGDSLIFFARTALRPTSVLTTLTEADREWRARELDSRAVGYYLATQTALSLDDLGREIADFGDAARESQGHVAVVEVAALVTPDSTVWQGSIDLLAHAAQLAPPGALREDIEAAHDIHLELLRSGRRSYAPGFFVQRSDGSVRYTLTVHQDGRHVVTMRGIRVSHDHLTDR